MYHALHSAFQSRVSQQHRQQSRLQSNSSLINKESPLNRKEERALYIYKVLFQREKLSESLVSKGRLVLYMFLDRGNEWISLKE